MLTKEKILLYNLYNGDLDNWSRCGSKKEQSMMSDAEWAMLGSYCQDIRIVQNGLAAAAFAMRLDTNLARDFDDEATIIFLKKLILERSVK